jgi:hypothetical protein
MSNNIGDSVGDTGGGQSLSACGAAALEWLAQGYAVVPVERGGKIPAVELALWQETLSAASVRAHFAQYPF